MSTTVVTAAAKAPANIGPHITAGRDDSMSGACCTVTVAMSPSPEKEKDDQDDRNWYAYKPK
jgi:hypothetical protein